MTSQPTSTPSPTAWPEQLRLPGQAAAPEGPVAMDMMYVMHHAFRRELEVFAAAAPVTPVSDRTTWRLLLERWELFAEILHAHHSGEDAGLWPWLLRHADAEERATLEAMEAEHEEIDPLLEACAAGLRRLATTADDDARAALAVRLVATRDSLARHLAHEETDAIAIIQRRMSPETWLEIEQEHFQKELTLRYVARVIPWVLHGVPRGVREALFSQEGGAGFRFLWTLTHRRFARRDRRTFRYVVGSGS